MLPVTVQLTAAPSINTSAINLPTPLLFSWQVNNTLVVMATKHVTISMTTVNKLLHHK